jgi:hypothetical protein
MSAKDVNLRLRCVSDVASVASMPESILKPPSSSKRMRKALSPRTEDDAADGSGALGCSRSVSV